MSSMRLLAISGSPRNGGNTECLLERSVAGAQSVGAVVEQVALNRLRIGPCMECNRCYASGRCVVEDDFQLLCDKALIADGVILAAPIFFMNVCAQAKAFVDRFQCLWALRYVLGQSVPLPPSGLRRRVAFLSTAGWQKTKFDCALTVVRAFSATIDAKLVGSVCINGVDAIQDIEKHPEALDQAFALGQELATWPVSQPLTGD